MPSQRLRKLSLTCALLFATLALCSRDAHSQAAPMLTTDAPAATLKISATADTQPPKSAPGFKTSFLFDEPHAQQDQQTQQQGTTQPPQQQTWTPLTPGAKMKRALRKAFLSPEGYVRSGISAAITEWGEEDLPHKDTEDRIADGLSRFAIRSASRATRTTLSSGVFAILFKQDPRYERSQSKNIGRRVLHAASRVWVTRGDNGRLQPNYSRWAGTLSASALSNIWERSTPGHNRIGVDATFRRFGTSFITDTWQTIIFSEFFPDLIRAIRR